MEPTMYEDDRLTWKMLTGNLTGIEYEPTSTLIKKKCKILL